MKIVIDGEYPQIKEALKFIADITDSASKILERTPKGLVQTIHFDNEEDGIKISISNE